jgi:hypothetical protein
MTHMTQLLDTVLLLALPASGKSEVRKYLDGLPAEVCQRDFHMGATVQLDDYPYVHFMHRIDDELAKRGQPYVFYKGPKRPFIDGFEWGTLIHMLNEDFADVQAQRTVHPASPAQWLFDRLDNAHAAVDLPRALGEVPYRIRCEIAALMDEEVAPELAYRNKICSEGLAGKTIVIEAARGGTNGVAFPLTPPQGYQYSLSQFSDDILNRASILYVWVTPEDSRRKNIERAKPDGQSSILHHSVPMEVMLGEYGLDDMEYLISQSSVADTVEIGRPELAVNEAGEQVYVWKTWNLPVGRFDNRADLTSFIRNETWQDDEVAALHSGLKSAFDKLKR